MGMGTVFVLMGVLAAGATDGRDLLRELVGRCAGVSSIDAVIEQHIRYPGAPPEVFRGRYRADAQGRFRIDYTAPSVQRVLHTGAALYWYYPADNLLYRIGGGGGSAPAPGARPADELMRRLDERGEVEYLGRRLYGIFTLAHRFVVRGDDPRVRIEVLVDSRRGVVLERRLLDERGREVVTEVFSDYDRTQGACYPRRIDVRARGERGVVRSTTVYRDARINIPLSPGLFAPDFPPNARRRLYRDR
ncbi:MAG TPA: hypothetical protein PKM65_14200 [Spirochaetota bacterium]|nr:hypothetical protein [Spirochaetota bacterium]HNT12917.1 hypothetical protein [Spirochaetota bacterium]